MVEMENTGAQAALDITHIVESYHTSVLRLAFLYLKDAHLAEDAAQETFIRAYRFQTSFRGDSSEKTWIISIAINVCRQFLRKAWWKQTDDTTALEQIPTEDAAAQVDDTTIVEVMRLPEKYKDVILLFYYQDLSIKDISKALDIPENTVAVRLNRARNLLHTRLKGWYYDE